MKKRKCRKWRKLLTREDLSHQLKGEWSNDTSRRETCSNLSLPVRGHPFVLSRCCTYSLITPSGLTSIPAGMETPDMIQLRYGIHDHTHITCVNTFHLNFDKCTEKRRSKKLWNLGRLCLQMDEFCLCLSCICCFYHNKEGKPQLCLLFYRRRPRTLVLQ